MEARGCPTLTLTPAGVSEVLGPALFAYNIPDNQSENFGPYGITFPAQGGVLVSDIPGNVRLFPSDTDGQDATPKADAPPSPDTRTR